MMRYFLAFVLFLCIGTLIESKPIGEYHEKNPPQLFVQYDGALSARQRIKLREAQDSHRTVAWRIIRINPILFDPEVKRLDIHANLFDAHIEVKTTPINRYKSFLIGGPHDVVSLSSYGLFVATFSKDGVIRQGRLFMYRGPNRESLNAVIVPLSDGLYATIVEENDN